MKQPNLTQEQKEELRRGARADIAFQEELEMFDKQSLSLLVTQLTASGTSREWVLSYVANIEQMYKLGGVIGQPTLREELLEAIDSQRIAQQAQHGPVGMDPREVPEWLDLIHRELAKADRAAATGAEMRALSGILMVATQCVAALEERMQDGINEGTPALRDVITQATEREDPPRPPAGGHPSAEGTPLEEGEQKTTTDEAATSPAGNVNGSDH